MKKNKLSYFDQPENKKANLIFIIINNINCHMNVTFVFRVKNKVFSNLIRDFSNRQIFG